ncbi:MAG: acyltransferase family protein [Clostridia bacterium]|nr:acyltransferase family protein [Clostridia bacterium]
MGKLSGSVSTSGRVEWVDIAKGIGIILVIIGHLGVPYTDLWIYTFHMPLFFFLSGVVFSGIKYKFKVFLVKRIKALVIPYFALSFGIFLFFTFLYVYHDKTGTTPPYFVRGALDTPVNMFVKFLVQRGYCTVWFLACLFVAEIIFYFVSKAAKRNLIVMSAISSAICIGGLVYYRLGGTTLPWNIDTALIAQFFMCMGYLFSNSTSLTKFREIITVNASNPVRCIMAVLFLAINVISGFASLRLSGKSVNMSIGDYGFEPLSFISALAGILFIITVASMIKSRFFSYLGRNTMLVFAWHSRIVIIALNYLYLAIGIFQSDGFIIRCIYGVVTTITILAILMPLDYLIQRSFLSFMVGRKRIKFKEK